MAATEKFMIFATAIGSYVTGQPKAGRRDAMLANADSKGWKLVNEVSKIPGIKAMETMSENAIAKATDGCKVGPDGICSHGCPSWLLALGII